MSALLILFLPKCPYFCAGKPFDHQAIHPIVIGTIGWLRWSHLVCFQKGLNQCWAKQSTTALINVNVTL